MGDRWSFPKQASSATYVWQPLTISGTSLKIPEYQQSWQIDLQTGVVSRPKNKDQILKNTDKEIKYSGNWNHSNENSLSESKSEDKNASFSIKFKGQQIGFSSFVSNEKCYAKVVVADEKGKTITSSIVDMYSKNRIETTVYRSPLLKKGNYILSVYNTGERPNWSDKKKTNYGSTGNFISVTKIEIKK